MSTYPKNTWDQLKGLSLTRLKKALRDDGWSVEVNGPREIWRHEGCEHPVILHYHPRKEFGPKLLKYLLDSIGWTEDDLKRLKLVK